MDAVSVARAAKSAASGAHLPRRAARTFKQGPPRPEVATNAGRGPRSSSRSRSPRSSTRSSRTSTASSRVGTKVGSRRRRGDDVDGSWAEAILSRYRVPRADNPCHGRGVDAAKPTEIALQAGLRTGRLPRRLRGRRRPLRDPRGQDRRGRGPRGLALRGPRAPGRRPRELAPLGRRRRRGGRQGHAQVGHRQHRRRHQGAAHRGAQEPRVFLVVGRRRARDVL